MGNRYKYTKEDEDFLKKYYPICDWNKIHKRFPTVSNQGIYRKCQKLGIKSNYDRTHTEKLLASRKRWTQEEIQVLKDNYSVIPVKQLCELLPSRNKDMILAKARSLHLCSYSRSQQIWKSEEIQYIYDNWKTYTDKVMAQSINRTARAIKAKREELGLYRSSPNESNYESLSKYLRGHLQQWKKESMKQCHYQCVLTKTKDFEIHHKYSFSKIIDEFLLVYPEYSNKSLDDFSQEDLFLIAEKFKEIHSQYPLGVCISKPLHSLFHTIYGQSGNTPEQWENFVTDYKMGKYKDI